ncbi:MAG: carboxypeptidase regulatory-like domain-containing protein [Acidobacteria bacterium]|nr:carboxypeptidase regulatory-like domain-containing protein [Acidobacteriota bacterium]
MRPPLVLGVTDGAGRLPSELPRLDDLLVLVDHDGYEPLVREIHGGNFPAALALGPGRRLVGHVSTGSRPVWGRVCARWHEDLAGWGWDGRWQRCTEVEPQGDFVVPGLPSSSEPDVEIEVQVRRRAPYRTGWRPGQPLEVELPTAEQDHVVRGRLLDLAGRAVSEGRVITQQGAYDVSGRDGGFEVPVERWPARLTVEAEGFESAERSVEAPEKRDAVETEEPGARVEIRLERSQGVHGVLLGAQNQQLAGATLRFEREVAGRRTSRLARLSVVKGEFHADLPAPGTYDLSFRAMGYREKVLPDVSIGDGESIDLGVVELARGAAVVGQVLDETTGEPLAGVMTELVTSGPALLAVLGRGQLPQAISDAAGRFELGGLTPGWYQLRLRYRGLAMAWHEVLVEEDRLVDLEPQLLGIGTSFKGCVVARGGVAAGKLDIRLFAPGHGVLWPLAEATTGDDGCFHTEPLAPGRYLVQVRGRGLLLAQETEHRRQPEEHRFVLSTVSAHLRVVDRGVPISGGGVLVSSVLDPANQRGKLQWTHDRIGGATAAFGLPEAFAFASLDADGTATLPDAPAGLIDLAITTAEGRVVHRRLVLPEPGDAAATVDIAGRKLLLGLCDAETGEPVADARLQVFDQALLPVTEATSNEGGVAVVAGLPPGPWIFEVRARRYRPLLVRVQDAPQPPEALSLALELGDPEPVEMALTRPSGAPAQDVLVSWLDASGRMVAAGMVGAGGDKTFAGLAAGEYSLAWMDALGGGGVSSAIEVGGAEADESGPVRVQISPGAPLRLSCSLPECGGREVEYLALRPDRGEETMPDVAPFLSGMSPALRLGADGGLTLGVVSPGRYSLELWVAGRRWTRSVRVDEGEGTFVSFP